MGGSDLTGAKIVALITGSDKWVPAELVWIRIRIRRPDRLSDLAGGSCRSGSRIFDGVCRPKRTPRDGGRDDVVLDRKRWNMACLRCSRFAYSAGRAS